MESSSHARLLVVDDEAPVRELWSGFLRAQGYACTPCADAAEALDQLARGGVDMVVSDLNMPGASGLELLQTMRRRYPQVGFLMVTAASDAATAIAALRGGAADYLMKPLKLQQLLQGVEQALERQRQQAASENYLHSLEQLVSERTLALGDALRQAQTASQETLQALAIALDVRAREVAGHSHRVSRYGLELARQMGYTPVELARFEYGAYLHDIGKLGIPDAILNKPGPLTPEETVVMRRHVQIGGDLVAQVSSLAPAAELVLAHQEHYDGGGYPRGLAGEAIPRDARVFAVADALDAMTSDRPYRKALSWSHARREIVHQSGRQFDPAVVEAFVAIAPERWKELQTGPGAGEAASGAAVGK